MMFSIVLCVNKTNPYLDDAINSILNQTFKDFEFIIIANNCNDYLMLQLRKYKDPRIKLHRTYIGQLSFNLNYGVNESTGDYIVRMDADDVSLPQRLQETKNILDVFQDVDVLACSCNLINSENEIVGEWLVGNRKNSLTKSNPYVHPATVIKKSSLLSVGGYLGGFQSEDYDLWLRMKKEGKKFVMSNTKVLNYRISEFQTKGNLLPYCEVSSYFFRELLLSPSFKLLVGLCISVAKVVKRKKQ